MALTIANSDVYLPDMSALVQIGGPTFEADPAGGIWMISDGVSARVKIATSLMNAAADNITVACIFQSPTHSAPTSGHIISADGPMRNYSIKFDGSVGKVVFQHISGAGVPTYRTITEFDDVVTYFMMCVFDKGTVGDETDHVGKMLMGPLAGTIIEQAITDTGVDYSVQVGLQETFFGNANDGTVPMPNGGRIGQILSWHNAIGTLADAKAVALELLAANGRQTLFSDTLFADSIFSETLTKDSLYN